MSKGAEKQRMGRPFKGEQPRTRTVNMRLSEAEYETVRAACERSSCSLADLVVAAAERELRKSKSP